jgi:large subunit ribosomal protein L24
MHNKIKIKKGDEIIVLAGKDKGKTGKVVKVIPNIRNAIVVGINKVKKHQKPDKGQAGGIVEKEMPIHISNLAYSDSSLKKGVRIGKI